MGAVTSQRFEALIRRRTERFHRQLADEILRLRDDAGLSQRRLAAAAGIDAAYVARIEDGRGRPSAETYARIGAVLGADFNGHLYANTGPSIRDRHQAPILEHLLSVLNPRWQPFPEAAVRRPSRGWIDCVLHDPETAVLIATEIVSELRRIEQLIRWSKEKANSLPSWDGWSRLPGPPAVSQLLILRRTRANATLAREFERQLRLAWPGHPGDALASLMGSEAWPGPTLLWVATSTSHHRFLTTRA